MQSRLAKGMEFVSNSAPNALGQKTVLEKYLFQPKSERESRNLKAKMTSRNPKGSGFMFNGQAGV